ncbi:MAG TPA: GreA/GreB family elongation factor [Acidobacteriota bacterium]|jgi:transcription elongation GreA/GreB family factor|nr:GreA/GreB family elongation factor [Acidobacteriota bacterium]HNR40509.1 GreA/GreB family elongation factor [Acidobacteriota bacterium]HNU02484.1 GreA/GreB family elongation factor [Acidobacteriota bacterium]HPB29680.1 GreA/GreB family elongation factor [Acidobacteriota bacterium]HQO27010.1 GreA/GreB family elongation factor [Acidobacteriota bacterium]
MDIGVKEQILATLRRELAVMAETSRRAAETAREGMLVGDERTRTRGERAVFNEQTYLVTAQMQQVERCQALLRALDDLDLSPARKARPGALLEIAAEGGLASGLYFLVPGGMGATVDVGGQSIQLVSPDSPLGRALLDRRPGADIAVDLPAGPCRLRLLAVV